MHSRDNRYQAPLTRRKLAALKAHDQTVAQEEPPRWLRHEALRLAAAEAEEEHFFEWCPGQRRNRNPATKTEAAILAAGDTLGREEQRDLALTSWRTVELAACMLDSDQEDCLARDDDGQLLCASWSHAGRANHEGTAGDHATFFGNKAFEQVQRLKSACV